MDQPVEHLLADVAEDETGVRDVVEQRHDVSFGWRHDVLFGWL